MSEQKPGFMTQVKSYPSTFWIANTMEIFERIAWYGFYTVSTLYITASTATGGLGFTSEQRGQIQAIVPFILYLLPLITGALADRYGYKKMFSISYIVMIVSYYLLGQFNTFGSFMAAFLFVAVGAAIFKPVVVGTVARVTNSSNSAMAFGIFYMMVNVGGFLGPIITGRIRESGWEYVFYACSAASAINLIIVTFFYKDPTTEAASGQGRTLGKVLDDMVEVLGNLRFFITVFTVLIALMVANQGFSWFSWERCWVFIPIWLVFNFIYDALLPAGSGRPSGNSGVRRSPFTKRMHCSNWRFALFLLIMSGFWTSFNQIFITMPEYIRDFTETRPLINAAEAVLGESDKNDPTVGIASKVATISDSERQVIVERFEELVAKASDGQLTDDSVEQASRELLESKIRIAPEQIKTMIEEGAGDAARITDQAIIECRQFNPEFIVNVDALSIIVFQVLISFLMAKFHRFTTMIVGMLVAAVGIGLSAFAGDSGFVGAGGSIWIVVLGIFIFAIGEMMASPTSQEYIGRIAPKDRVAVYMGYYFVSVALGNLFGGILSGQMYGKLARDMQRPDLMWLAFGGLMVLTAVAMVLYNKFALPKEAAMEMNGPAGDE